MPVWGDRVIGVLADKYIRVRIPEQITWGNVIMYLVRHWLQPERGGMLEYGSACTTDRHGHRGAKFTP